VAHAPNEVDEYVKDTVVVEGVVEEVAAVVVAVVVAVAVVAVVVGALHELVLVVFARIVVVQELEKLHVTILDRYQQERIRPEE
jgi:hypothetical protein